MAVYRSTNNKPLNGYNPAIRISGQMVLSGTDPEFLTETGVFFLEMLQLGTGATVTIKDGDDVTIATTVSSFSQDQSPLRCDKGIKFTGTVIMAKGFVMEGCF
jgi:hypothetical protein